MAAWSSTSEPQPRPMSADPPAQPQPERHQPLALLGITLIALAGFAVFFLSFLVAPLAILAIFYVGFAASDRSKRNGNSARLQQEAEARQLALQRAELEAAAAAPRRTAAEARV